PGTKHEAHADAQTEVSAGLPPQPQGETAPRAERSSGSHSTPGGPEHGAETSTSEGDVRRGPERIEDGLVANNASPTPGKTRRGGIQHPTDDWPVQGGLAPRNQTRLDQSSAVQRPRSATDRRRETVPDGSPK